MEPTYVFEQVALLNEDGTPVVDALGNPVLVWALPAAVRYDWLRVTFNEKHHAQRPRGRRRRVHRRTVRRPWRRRDYRQRRRGPLRAGFDCRPSHDAQEAGGERNVTAAGDMRIAAIGGSLGTSAASPLTIQVGGEITAVCAGGVYFDALGNVILDLTSGTNNRRADRHAGCCADCRTAYTLTGLSTPIWRFHRHAGDIAKRARRCSWTPTEAARARSRSAARMCM